MSSIRLNSVNLLSAVYEVIQLCVWPPHTHHQLWWDAGWSLGHLLPDLDGAISLLLVCGANGGRTVHADPETLDWMSGEQAGRQAVSHRCHHHPGSADTCGLTVSLRLSSWSLWLACRGPPRILPPQTITDLPPNWWCWWKLHAAEGSLQPCETLSMESRLTSTVPLLSPSQVTQPVPASTSHTLHHTAVGATFSHLSPPHCWTFSCLLCVSRSRGSPAAPGHPGPPQHLKQRQQPWDLSRLHQLHW